MKKSLYVLSFLFVFTACNEEEILKKILGDAPEPPAGLYQTGCMTGSVEGNESGSEKYLAELSDDGTLDMSVRIYAASTTCGSNPTDRPLPISILDFKGIDLGDDVSFAEIDSSDDQGQPEKSFRPYKYEKEGKVWIVGHEAEGTSTPTNPGDVFSDFIGSPRENAEFIFIEVDEFDQI